MNLEDDILIDNYLRGLLDENALVDFENRLKNDDAFKANFELEKRLWQSQNPDDWSFINIENQDIRDYKKILETDEFRDLKENLKKADSEFKSIKKKKTYRLLYYIAAASIVLFLGFQFFNGSATNEELYVDYFKKTELPTFASRDSPGNDLVDGQQLFENGNYENALVVFRSHMTNTDNKASILIYKGLSETELSKFDEAEETFDTLINSNLIDAQKGYWYKALLHLKKDDILESKIVLKKIISDRLYNKENAKQLLQDLD